MHTRLGARRAPPRRRSARTPGDGNPGAWNALEQLGARRAWPAFVGDGLKALIPVALAHVLWGYWPAWAAALGAMAGHAFPLPDPRKGGKAVMCFVGAAIALAPAAALACAVLCLARHRRPRLRLGSARRRVRVPARPARHRPGRARRRDGRADDLHRRRCSCCAVAPPPPAARRAQRRDREPDRRHRVGERREPERHAAPRVAGRQRRRASASAARAARGRAGVASSRQRRAAAAGRASATRRPDPRRARPAR